MTLLERVSTLIRANLNDLIEKAEEPEKMIRQVILDMENQLIQLKTQVAVAVADQHLLEKKRKEVQDKAAEWMQKAELAVEKQKDDLARAALERSVSHQRMAESFLKQEADQKMQTELLKTSLKTLAEKLAQAQIKRDLLVAKHRRVRALPATQPGEHGGIASELLPDNVEEKFARLEKEDQIERLLAELKGRKGLKA